MAKVIPFFLRIERKRLEKVMLCPSPRLATFCLYRCKVSLFGVLPINFYPNVCSGRRFRLRHARHDTKQVIPTPVDGITPVPRFAFTIDAHAQKIVGVCVSVGR